MFFLGVGSFYFEKIPKTKKYLYFFYIEILLSFVGISGFLYIVYLSNFYIQRTNYTILILIHLPIILVGFLSGLELPLLIEFGKEKTKKFSKILGFDYLGSLISSLVYSIFLYPKLGLLLSILIVGLLNAIVAVFFLNYYSKKIKPSFTLRILSIIFVLTIVAMIIHSSTLNDLIEKTYFKNSIKTIYQYNKIPIKSINIEKIFRTPYQAAVFYTVNFNYSPFIQESDKCMNLDSHIQACESWVTAYHNGLVDIPFSIIKNITNVSVLLLGGGDWIPLAFLKKYNASVDMVDIDRQFYEFAKEDPFLKKYNNHSYTYNNYRLYTEDALMYLRKNKKKYDIILIDLPGVKEDKLIHVYSYEFYRLIRNSLKQNGFAVMWIYKKEIYPKHHYTLLTTLKKAGFKYLIHYTAYIIKADSIRPTEEFLILSNLKTTVSINTSRSPYIKKFEKYYKELKWENISLLLNNSKDFYPNSIFKINPNILIKH